MQRHNEFNTANETRMGLNSFVSIALLFHLLQSRMTKVSRMRNPIIEKASVLFKIQRRLV